MMREDKIATIPVTEEGPANLHVTYMYSMWPGNIRVEDACLFTDGKITQSTLNTIRELIQKAIQQTYDTEVSVVILSWQWFEE